MPEVQMPRLSDTMQEGTISRWLKAEGDQVVKGDILAEIETDKATMDLEAYDEGPLTALLVAEGTTVPIGQAIAIIGEPASTAAPSTSAAPDRAASGPLAPAATTVPRGGDRVRATPLVRRLAREHSIDLTTVDGTGPGGRIVRTDIAPAIAAQRSVAPSVMAAPPPIAAPGVPSEDAVPLTPIRRIAARRLTESAAVPQFYLTSTIDSEPLTHFRAQVNEAMTGGGEKTSVTDLLVRACAVALQAHPYMNASWAGDKIIRHRQINIGIAVATDAGLIVPVVKDADTKTIRQIGAETRALAERAKAGTLSPSELSGGTFTVSNLGMFGIDHFTAIINPPEAAILAVGASRDTPVIRNGDVVAGSTITMTLSVDHRVVDGAPAAVFLRELTRILQTPLLIVA